MQRPQQGKGRDCTKEHLLCGLRLRESLQFQTLKQGPEWDGAGASEEVRNRVGGSVAQRVKGSEAGIGRECQEVSWKSHLHSRGPQRAFGKV